MAGVHAAVLGSGKGYSPVVNITDQTVIDAEDSLGPTGSVATYNLNSSGTVTDHDGTLLETWLTSGLNSECEVRATLNSGAVPASGTLNTWEVLSTTRSWTQTRAAGDLGFTTSNLTIEIRYVATGVILDSATIVVRAEQF